MSLTQGILYIPVIFILHAQFGLHGVIWSMTVTELMTTILGIVLFLIFRLKIKKGTFEKSVVLIPEGNSL
ncbi:Multidrug export protein MepA [compost metagenome]